MRSASFAPIACLNVMSTRSLDVGPDQADFENATCSGCGSENAPLVRWPGSDTVSAASPAVLITFAVDDAVYSFATPGVNAPNVAGAPSVSDSVAGTVPPTGASSSSPPVAVVKAFEPPTTGIATDVPARSTVTSVPGCGRSVNRRSLENTIRREPLSLRARPCPSAGG